MTGAYSRTGIVAMLILVSYDVSTETKSGRKRLREVAKVCQNYGQRVQKSVFECQVDKNTLHKLRNQLLDTYDQQEDSLRIYRIKDPTEENVEEYGKNESIDFEGPLIA